MARQRFDIVLAALAAGGAGGQYDPVRVQKLFFLIDREVAEFIDGPYFRFEPYHYGPFDKAVYEDLEVLAEQGKINIDTTGRYSRYSLTDSGRAMGERALDALPEPAARYMEDAAKWVRFVPFKRLLLTIYRQYPDMAVNSIIPIATSRHSHASFFFPMPSFLTGMARSLDFMGTLNNYRAGWSNERLDALAVYHDWSAVGDDLGAAMNAHLVKDTSHEPQA